MALDARKRQKQVERRKAKEKKRKAQVAKPDNHLRARLERTATAPVLHCITTESLWILGMSTVLFSRELNNGTVAFANFLVDMHCLGVKDAFSGIVSRITYRSDVYARSFAPGPALTKLRPECARKLIEGAVQFAQDLGFAPHADYRQAKAIFGNIDPSDCTEEFEYGKDGKPYFVAGPHDGPDRCRYIVNVLTQRCGPDGFHFVVPVSADEMMQDTLGSIARFSRIESNDESDEDDEPA